MSDIFNYEIGGIFEIFSLSVLGFFLPFYFYHFKNVSIEKMTDEVPYRCVKSFSAGIIIGVAFLHLLADSIDRLSDFAEYPVALAMALVGFMATLALEQLAMHTMLTITDNSNELNSENQDDTINSREQHDLNNHNHNHNHNHIHNNDNNKNNYSNLEFSEIPELQVQSSELSNHVHVHEHVHSKQMVPDKDSHKSFIKSIVLEAAIACHSIIVGFGVGATNNLDTLKVLLVAIGLHQFFEGIGLGAALLEGKISMKYVYTFGALFAFAAPIGIVLGLYSASDDKTGIYVSGFAIALAAGALIYSSTIDMIAEDYMDNNFKTKHGGKACMYFSLSLGVCVMAILAIWA